MLRADFSCHLGFRTPLKGTIRVPLKGSIRVQGFRFSGLGV